MDTIVNEIFFLNFSFKLFVLMVWNNLNSTGIIFLQRHVRILLENSSLELCAVCGVKEGQIVRECE